MKALITALGLVVVAAAIIASPVLGADRCPAFGPIPRPAPRAHGHYEPIDPAGDERTIV